MRKKKSNNANKSDIKLEQIIKKRLAKDPFHYANFLLRILDCLPYTMKEDDLLKGRIIASELPRDAWDENGNLKKEYKRNAPRGDSPLIPSVQKIDNMSKYVATLSSDQLSALLNGDESIAFTPQYVVSPASIDELFYPWNRKLLKKWQQTFFDENLSTTEREKAKDKIKRVFELLTYQGQTGPKSGNRKSISPLVREQIEYDFREVNKKCYEICKKAKRKALRVTLLKKYFPNEANSISEKFEITGFSPERLRNIVLAVKYEVSERKVEESLRDTLETMRFIKSFKACKKS